MFKEFATGGTESRALLDQACYSIVIVFVIV